MNALDNYLKYCKKCQ